MGKIVYVDVGTHFAQEFQSFFGSQKYFYTKIIRRLIGSHVLRRGEMISLSELRELMRQRHDLRRKKNCFISFFVEANARVIQHSDVYRSANGVFNCALTGDQQFSLINLYLANSDQLSQGSSIFSTKSNVSVNDAVPTAGVPSGLFFRSLKGLIERSIREYSVILRLNCEGVEDDVIYSAHEVFSDKLALVMGSLDDVRGCKGDDVYDALQQYLTINNLPFVSFSSEISSWSVAHKSINEVHKCFFE
ncbi:hypothetical protein N8524_08100 [Candidatus Puniceispirillum sp.]|jgi:hypothetical protein|nr:hypothetical protein [Candidatus Puniceispirillum sp.]